MSTHYAAYRHSQDWVPLSSISNDPETVAKWINSTYHSYEARKEFIIVKVSLKIVESY